MERRLLTFIVASTAFFLCYAWLRIMFAPPVVVNEENPAAAVAEAAPIDPLGEVAAETSQDIDPKAAVPDRPDRPDRPQWVTLGSMDPESGHNMLVTLSSRGGAIERIELTKRDRDGELKYRRIDVFSGYLGYLAGESASQSSGVLVNVVGPGTPAAVAGLAIGDVIVSLAGTPVADREAIEAALAKTKPGDVIAVEVLRGDSAAPMTLSATLTEHPLDLVRLARDGGVDQIAGNQTRPSCLMTLGQVDRKSILTNQRSIQGLDDPTALIWNMSSDQQADTESVEFDFTFSAGEMQTIGGKPVRLKRSYSLTPGSYVIGMSVQVDNLSDQPQDLAYRLEGPNGITLEGWWYSNKISPNFFSGAAARDIVYKTAADGHRLISGYDLLKRFKAEPKDPSQTIFAPDGSDDARNLKYIAVDCAVLHCWICTERGSRFVYQVPASRRDDRRRSSRD